jgi:hypothetical protein
MELLLKDEGMIVIEVPYLLDLMKNLAFDTIYHQHLCYFSVTALASLFQEQGLYLNDLKRLWIHGGSLRLFLSKKNGPSPLVENLLKEEEELRIGNERFYRHFINRIRQLRIELPDLLQNLKASGDKIVAYGAAGKATTLLSYCNIDNRHLDYVVDLSSFKQGKFMPGNKLPIMPVSRLLEDQPEYCLLLVWNFAEEVLNQQNEYINRGGRFIIPIPEIRIV